MSTIDHTLVAGIRGRADAAVSDENTAIARDSGDLPVLATVSMIGLMEKAAYSSALPHLPEGWHTVGTRVHVTHVSATPVGAGFYAESELISIEGRKLTFRVSCYDVAGLIGEGAHERFLVERTPFLEKMQAKLK